MNQPLFVKYANLRLDESLDGFNEFCESFPDIPIATPDDLPRGDLTVSGYLISFAKIATEFGLNLRQAEERLAEIMAQYGPRYMSPRYRPEIQIAFEAIHGHYNHYCTSQDEAGLSINCFEFSFAWRREYWCKNCIECGRRAFASLLSRIATGEPVDEIKGLAILKDRVSHWRLPSGWRDPLGTDLSGRTGPDFDHPWKHILTSMIHSVVGQELFDFIKNKGPEWLHVCEHCGGFFTGHPNRKTCPPPKNCQRKLSNLRARSFVRDKRAQGDPKYF